MRFLNNRKYFIEFLFAVSANCKLGWTAVESYCYRNSPNTMNWLQAKDVSSIKKFFFSLLRDLLFGSL